MLIDSYNTYLITKMLAGVPVNNYRVAAYVDDFHSRISFSGNRLILSLLCYLSNNSRINTTLISIEIIHYYYHFGIRNYEENIEAKLNITKEGCHLSCAISPVDIIYDSLDTIINKKMLITQFELLPEINDIISTYISSLYLSL